MNDLRIDSHKLMYHVGRVNQWLGGKAIYPIYIEIAPTGGCNHRCIYCALDFMGYQPRFLESSTFKHRLKEMGQLGIKSIMYAGEGEPLLHKDIVDIITFTKKSGIDVALTTNGVLFEEGLAKNILPYLSWVKVSIDAGTKETYARIHRAKAEDFDKVMDNLACAATIKRKKGYKCTLGMQIILLPENHNELNLLAEKAKKIGMDYLVVKPYSQHPLSITKKYKNIKYKNYINLADGLNKLNDNTFSVIFRLTTMKKWDKAKRSYKHCLALPFWAYIDSGGDVWGCSIYLTKDKFCLGNIYKKTFKEILRSKKTIQLHTWAAKELDTDECRINCRMDEVNRFLWELKHPGEHVNFI